MEVFPIIIIFVYLTEEGNFSEEPARDRIVIQLAGGGEHTPRSTFKEDGLNLQLGLFAYMLWWAPIEKSPKNIQYFFLQSSFCFAKNHLNDLLEDAPNYYYF